MFTISHIFDNWTFVLYLIIYLALLIGAAGYIVIINRYRSKIRLYNLRNDWTNKLHNDIGGDLSSVALHLQLLKRRLIESDKDAEKNLDNTLEILGEVQSKLRFVFDLIDTKKNSLKIILQELESFAHKNCKMLGLELEINNHLKYDDSNLFDIGRVNKLYLVLKEALSNCIKHSKATRLCLNIEEAAKGINVLIKDDGIGFDLNKGFEQGNGLSNMIHMSNEAIMDIDIRSEIDQGTEIQCFIPYV